MFRLVRTREEKVILGMEPGGWITLAMSARATWQTYWGPQTDLRWGAQTDLTCAEGHRRTCTEGHRRTCARGHRQTWLEGTHGPVLGGTDRFLSPPS